MRDLFDDFMDELRRREAAARGEDPDTVAPRRRRDPVAGGEPEDADRGGGDPDATPEASATGSDDEPTRPIDLGRAAGGGGRGRRPPRRARGGPNDGGGFGNRVRRAGRTAGLTLGIAAILAIVVLFGVGIELWTDALWYRSVGYDDVFWTRIGAQAALFAIGLVIALVVLVGNLLIAARLTPPPAEKGGTLRSLFERLNEAAQAAETGRTGGARRWDPGGERRQPATIWDPDELPDFTPIAGWVLGGLAVFIALGVAGSLASTWETILLWQNRVPYSETAAVTDPIFGRDISFFLFELPFLRLVQALFNGLVIGGLFLAISRYLVGAMRGASVFSTQVRVHLGVLGGLFLLSVAFGYQLDKFELVYSTRGIGEGAAETIGVSYTDQNAQFLAYDVLTVLSGLGAAFLVGGAFTRTLWPLGLTLSIWFLASILIGRAYPWAIQEFTVKPNQLAQEERYISNNINMTRIAYGLDTWDASRGFRGEDVLTDEAIESESDTFRNARLWDYRPLGDSLDQLQTIRRYYNFFDVDTDRYLIDGVQRQVMLSAREMDLERNPGATGWVNQRITFTHGIGVAMVPVNEVSNEGQPRLLVRNLPPVSSNGAPEVTEPRIYFGELPSDYVVVGAKQAEFDYPTGQGEGDEVAGVETKWTGDTGIPLDNTLMRLLYALRFRDLDLLITDQVTNESQLLFHRSLGDRLPAIAPFLRYDKDPYIVIDEDTGGLVYIQDAYTLSNRFPHANGFNATALEGSGLGARTFNYIRNSVKIAVNAYDGATTFYVADPDDPLIRSYQKIFPTLFRPLDEMSDSLRAHVRFPEELFNVQARIYGRYHVTNPRQFFTGDDLWTVPQGQTSEQTLPSEAYYVIMRMPGESESEFLLLQPMVPTDRPNMIAWVAARNDGENYGTTRVYRFPTDTTVFGPAQIEARIDQDPLISQQITLWASAGSRVIRGNLIVVPVRDSMIYLQPVYLQSTGSAFPEFRRIVVASPREVVWAETLGESLRLLLEAEAGNGPSPAPTPTPEPGESPPPEPTATPATGSPEPGATPPAGDLQGLIEYANTHFELAQQALRDGDFARYGEEMELVEEALRQLDELVGGEAPNPAP